MNKETSTNFLEYIEFLTFFYKNPFTLYHFTTKPLYSHILQLLVLENSYYNSFYIISLVKCYLDEKRKIDDVEIMRKLSLKVFLKDNLHTDKTQNPTKQTKDAIVNNIEIERLKIMLSDYNKDIVEHKITFMTRNILIINCLELRYNSIFLEAFAVSIDNITTHRNLIKKILSYLNYINISTYLNEELEDEELNYKIDFLELCLYIINIYLEQSTVSCELGYFKNEKLPGAVLEEQVSLLYQKTISELNSIEIGTKDYSFAKIFFDEMYTLLTTAQVLENDLFVIFKYTFSIFILVSISTDENLVTDIIIRTMMSKEFMIREELMVDLQIQIIKCLHAIKNTALSTKHLKTILNTNAIAFLTKSNREKVIAKVKKYEVLSFKEIIDITRRAYFNIKVKLDESKNYKRENRECINLLCVFLAYIAYSDVSACFLEINNYFTSFNNYNESIEYYADFLSRNNFEAPLWTFLRSSDSNYLLEFYMSFFLKVKKNCEQKQLNCINTPFEYSLMIDKHVTNFCKIFLERKDANLLGVFNAIPYLPDKEEYYAIYFHLWRFIFDTNLDINMDFFKYKTPALVNLTTELDFSAIINSDIIFKVVKLLKAEKNKEIFSRTAIESHYTHFLFVLILFVEREKIRNYIFDGVYGYITDTKLLKDNFESLLYVMIGIHYSYKTNYYQIRKYLLTLLRMFVNSYFSTRKIIYEIAKLIIKNEKFLIFDLEVNLKFNNCIKALKRDCKSKKEQSLILELIDTYRLVFLSEIGSKTSFLNNYYILSFSDIAFLKELKIDYSKQFAFLTESVQCEMRKILDFSDKTKSDIEFEGDKSYMWLLDFVYMNRYDPVLMRKSINLLKKQLNKEYNLEKLYILLKIYNILGIREEESEELLKRAIYIPLNFGDSIDLIKKLQKETTDFYEYYFSQTLFIYYGNTQEISQIPFPSNKTSFDGFDMKDIVFVYNLFRKKTLLECLMGRDTKQYLNYFYDITSLNMHDVISILLNSEEKEMIKIALHALKKHNVINCIPQLVQCLTRPKVFSDVFLALHELCRDKYVCHFTLWNLKSNVSPQTSVFSECITDLESNNSIFGINKGATTLEDQQIFLQQIFFFNELTKISSQMMRYLRCLKQEKIIRLNELLEKIQVPNGIYLPTDIEYEIVKIAKNSGKILQSHAKVPFMASFYCVKQTDLTEDIRCIINNLGDDLSIIESPIVIKHLIFKAGDDCRQDMLAIQLITMFRDIFHTNKLDMFLYPYKVIATGPETGIIEVIADAITRDQMGREKINNLVDYFEFKFGFRESKEYIQAVSNFTKSFAAYSLVTYFLNIKDRHNGNIMIDSDGHIIHIDFGYMLELSPGNINIEIPIKLTREIYDLMLSSEQYEIYVDLVVKGFFVLRRNSKDLIFMVDSFKNSGLPCFRRKAVQNFINRFKFNLPDDEAKIFIVTLVNNSIRKMRTWLYDKYQEFTNNIAF